jgi:SAM-dependent methyltransferase
LFREETGTPTRVPDDWYVGFHTGLPARFWRAAGAAMADGDAALVLALLDEQSTAHVLDVPCGDGRLTVRLAAAGYRATGVDIIGEEVERARRAAEEAGVEASFQVGDLRDLSGLSPVDAIVSWGNSFGYLLPADSERSLAGMRRLLRPGGRLVLDSPTVAEALLSGGVKREDEYEFGGIRMTITNHYRVEESRLESDLVLEADGVVEHARSAHHVHTTGELVRWLKAAGFGRIRLLSGDGESPYELGAPRLIVVADA